MIEEKLLQVIHNITNISITDKDSSLFGFQYYLSAEKIVYILLALRKEFEFEIDNDFVDGLNDCSFKHLFEAIVEKLSVSNLDSTAHS